MEHEKLRTKKRRGKGKGRPTVLEYHGLTLEDIVQSYKNNITLAETAKALGIDEKSVRKYLTQAGVKRRRGQKTATSFGIPENHSGCLAEWIKKNPDAALPSSPAEIARMTGCTEDQVRTYIYRRTRKLKQGIRELPDLKGNVNGPRVYHDKNGQAVPVMAISQGTWSYNTRNFTVSYLAEMKNGTYRRVTKHLEDWQALLQSD